MELDHCGINGRLLDWHQAEVQRRFIGATLFVDFCQQNDLSRVENRANATDKYHLAFNSLMRIQSCFKVIRSTKSTWQKSNIRSNTSHWRVYILSARVENKEIKRLHRGEIVLSSGFGLFSFWIDTMEIPKMSSSLKYLKKYVAFYFIILISTRWDLHTATIITLFISLKIVSLFAVALDTVPKTWRLKYS